MLLGRAIDYNKIEILSKSTRKKDKGEKRKEYLSLPSLEEYVLISC